MAITWDKTGERFYETGTDHGVLYQYDKDAKTYKDGVAWNGLTAVTASPSGAEPSPMFADNIKYANPMSTEEYGGTIEAYTYPEEFAQNDGSFVYNGVSVGQQARATFGFSWRTRIGNDVDGDSHGYKLHLVWGALAQPSEKPYSTVNDSPEAITFSWSFTTTPVSFDPDGEFSNLRPTAYMTLNSTKISTENMKAIEDKLYGVGGSATPTLPTPDEVLKMVTSSGSEEDVS